MGTTGAQVIGWLRTGVGVAMVSAPGLALRLAGGLEPTATGVVLLRIVGVRDIVVGLGAVTAARRGISDESRRWSTVAAASDALDTVVCMASYRAIGKRDAAAAGLASAVFVVADLAARRAVRTATV